MELHLLILLSHLSSQFTKFPSFNLETNISTMITRTQVNSGPTLSLFNVFPTSVQIKVVRMVDHLSTFLPTSARIVTLCVHLVEKRATSRSSVDPVVMPPPHPRKPAPTSSLKIPMTQTQLFVRSTTINRKRKLC